jgi:glycosyltransferase domain-containing protein
MNTDSMSLDRSVTLIIPTVHYRATLFTRTLRYLQSAGFKSQIIVSDHSPAECSGIISDIIRQTDGLDATLLVHPAKMHFLERLADCAHRAVTPYVHLHADDDFLIRPTLLSLIGKMDADPRCAAAMGVNIHVVFAPPDVKPIPKVGLDQPKPFDRLIAQLENYSSALYALRRRGEFINSMTFTVSRCPDVQFWQYLESCMTAIEGPFSFVDELHYVRERHLGKWSHQLVEERSPDHFPYLILSPHFHQRVEAFRQALAEACAERDIAFEQSAIENGIIHLLFRGFGAMGLPPTSASQKPDAKQHAMNFMARLTNANDSATRELRRIFSFASKNELSLKRKALNDPLA